MKHNCPKCHEPYDCIYSFCSVPVASMCFTCFSALWHDFRRYKEPTPTVRKRREQKLLAEFETWYAAQPLKSATKDAMFKDWMWEKLLGGSNV